MIPGSAPFVAIALACFAVVGIALWTGKIVGFAFRGRFIARRGQEPGLYWASVIMVGAFGALFAFAVISENLRR